MAGPERQSDRVTRWARLERPARILVWLLIVLAVVALYNQTSRLVATLFGVILLFIFAAIVALLLTPVVDKMETMPPFRGHRAIAVLALLLVVSALLAGGVVLIFPALVTQAKGLPALVVRVQGFLLSVETQLNHYGIPVHISLSALGTGSDRTFIGSAIGVLTGTVTTVIDILLVIVITVYLLVQGRALVAALRKLFPGHSNLFDFTLVAVGSTFAAYARGQLIMSVVMGLYTGLVMTAIGVHYAIVIGVITFFLEFLPLVGAPIGMALAVVVATFQSPLIAALAALAGLGGHAIEAYILGPRVTGQATRLHPLAAMAALLVGAQLGGILGALFAIPLAGIANVFLGALYRSQRGEEALTTSPMGEVHEEALPRLGEEISDQSEEGAMVNEPVPHTEGEEAPPRKAVSG